MTECNVSACPEHWRCDQIHEATCCATYRLECKKRDDKEAKSKGFRRGKCEECGKVFWVEVKRSPMPLTCSEACGDARRKRMHAVYDKQKRASAVLEDQR